MRDLCTGLAWTNLHQEQCPGARLIGWTGHHWRRVTWPGYCFEQIPVAERWGAQVRPDRMKATAGHCGKISGKEFYQQHQQLCTLQLSKYFKLAFDGAKHLYTGDFWQVNRSLKEQHLSPAEKASLASFVPRVPASSTRSHSGTSGSAPQFVLSVKTHPSSFT